MGTKNARRSLASRLRLDPGRAYVAAAAVALVASGAWVILGHDPLVMSPAMPASFGLSGGALVAVSAVLGVAFAVFSIRVSRSLARGARWASELARTLGPRLAGASDAELLKTALLVGATEELLFRGILVPLVGVWLSSLFFGLVHAGRGRAHAFYAVWAGLTGLVLGSIFWLTGSLVGPLLAHVAINAANARFLRDLAPAEPRRRALGGLLSR